MPLPPSILYFGQDPILVSTRQQIVRYAGFESHVAQSVEALHRCFAEHAVDVLVICHTVSIDERERAKRLAHSQDYPTLVLVLYAGTRDVDETEASFDTTLGPKGFLRALFALLKWHDQR